MTFDPRSAYPHFYDNPVVGSMAARPRWTVSDSSGRPIDAVALLENGSVHGARTPDRSCLVTLKELTEHLPQAANATWRVETDLDDLVVLDIEKTCPRDTALELLAIPNLYAELSRSGRGFHLVLPRPRAMDLFPAAARKIVVRHPRGWYEVLQSHYVTFTRWALPPELLEQIRRHVAQHGTTDFEEVYSRIAELVHDEVEYQSLADDEEPEIPLRDKLLEKMTRERIVRDLDDFDGDTSRWEVSHMGTLYNRLDNLLKGTQARSTGFEYGPAERAWLVYRAAERMLPWRPKHDETRHGAPLLLSAAQYVVAHRYAESHDQTMEEA